MRLTPSPRRNGGTVRSLPWSLLRGRAREGARQRFRVESQPYPSQPGSQVSAREHHCCLRCRLAEGVSLEMVVVCLASRLQQPLAGLGPLESHAHDGNTADLRLPAP